MLMKIDGGITAPAGFTAAGVKAGIKKSGKEDVAIIYSSVPAAVAAVFTANKIVAAPVIVSRRVVDKGRACAIVVNSGCANSCTGQQGLIDAQSMAHMTASALNIKDCEVVVASTGVIGMSLPMGKLAEGIKKAAANLSVDGHQAALEAIMTTDTFPKSSAYRFTLGGVPVKIAGIAKGAGMIHPNMATMLSFLTTDAAISPAILKQALKQAVEVSFNAITIDGDTSTNDTVCVLANGQAGNAPIDSGQGEDYQAFVDALTATCTDLAKLVVRDGEGATKFLEITVKGAVSLGDAKTAAMAVAKSPLVKTAFFGQDPNWGRIICAIGYSGAQVVTDKTSLTIGGITTVRGGQGCEVDAPSLKAAMAAKDIAVTVDLGLGPAAATVWTCDFSYDYVKINAEYTT
ncbi:MAG TPA: bifunctional glutamate N-acetyltransferase/amino-acid acetyltransferase ArgJ [Methylomusa anaerophila]|uniref:Arginine biosynthesis bifunctional protein ArgJ n=1 Tax=Methylomusa anaerophila TaxID=1930071 RepID=A0A348AK17_9FIRM|nr:bifunctional glutamate N-acetyltransferase/amino-acid acetyltransferase ArgJ [Methylomusa anaerophila]BBB91415.1 arginine biosynthesis bifunctional protein ArgJ [Methylomusa anaerophila]HML90160.1 bifunctional glutamate N-acetyltransferase/amino-acid acetyltransferase ArgJ [Methylomusa anaerophila]